MLSVCNHGVTAKTYLWSIRRSSRWYLDTLGHGLRFVSTVERSRTYSKTALHTSPLICNSGCHLESNAQTGIHIALCNDTGVLALYYILSISVQETGCRPMDRHLATTTIVALIMLGRVITTLGGEWYQLSFSLIFSNTWHFLSAALYLDLQS